MELIPSQVTPQDTLRAWEAVVTTSRETVDVLTDVESAFRNTAFDQAMALSKEQFGQFAGRILHNYDQASVVSQAYISAWFNSGCRLSATVSDISREALALGETTMKESLQASKQLSGSRSFAELFCLPGHMTARLVQTWTRGLIHLAELGVTGAAATWQPIEAALRQNSDLRRLMAP